MNTNEVILISEEPDGTTTIVDIIEPSTDQAAHMTNNDNESLAEEVIETILGHEIDLDANDTSDVHHADAGDANDLQDATLDHQGVAPIDGDDFSAADFHGGDSTLTADAADFGAIDSASGHFGADEFSGADLGTDATVEAGGDIASSSSEDATDPQAQAHVDAATEAQEQADAAVASGDYETAAQLREDAENEAYAAGDN